MELTNEFRVGVPVEQAWRVLTDVERIAPCLPGAELQEVEGEEYRGVVKVKVGPITAQYKGKATFVERDASARRAVLQAEGRDTRGAGNASATITATLDDDGDGTRVEVVTDLTITGKVAQFGRGVLADVSAKLLGQFVESLEADVLSSAEPSEPAEPVEVAVEARAPSPATAGGVGNGGPDPDAEPARPAAGAGASAPPDPDDEPPPEPAGEPAAPAEAEPAWSAAAPEPADVATDVPSSNGAGGVRRIESPAAKPVDLLDTAGGPLARRAAPAVGAVVFLLWLFTRRRRRKHR